MFETEQREAINLIAIVTIACLGGLVKWARNPYGTAKRTIFGFVTCVFTAAFVGMQAHFLMNWLGVDLSLQFAISGAAGYGGGMLLDAAIPLLIRFMYRKVGFNYDESDETHELNTPENTEEVPSNDQH